MFTTEFGTPVDPRNVLRTIEQAAAKAGIENVSVPGPLPWCWIRLRAVVRSGIADSAGGSRLGFEEWIGSNSERA